MQKRGLAGAGFSHQTKHFAALDIQRKAGENHQVGIAGAVDFREIARANEGLRHATATITQFEGSTPSAQCGFQYPAEIACIQALLFQADAANLLINLWSRVEPGGSRQLQFYLQRYNGNVMKLEIEVNVADDAADKVELQEHLRKEAILALF